MQRCPGAAGIIVDGRTKTPDGAVDGGDFHHVTILSDHVSSVKQLSGTGWKPVPLPAQHGRRDASVTVLSTTPNLESPSRGRSRLPNSLISLLILTRLKRLAIVAVIVGLVVYLVRLGRQVVRPFQQRPTTVAEADGDPEKKCVAP